MKEGGKLGDRAEARATVKGRAGGPGSGREGGADGPGEGLGEGRHTERTGPALSPPSREAGQALPGSSVPWGAVTGQVPCPPPQVSDKFAFGLFDLDWEVFAQHIEGAVNRVPVLEKTGIKSTVCGPGEWAAPEAGRPSVLGLGHCVCSPLQAKDVRSVRAEVRLWARGRASSCPPPRESLLRSHRARSLLDLPLELGVFICKMG